MRHVKSERLKKLESDLIDLEQWLKLGLVPKKDIEKHKEEIIGVQAKIEEEKERLQFLKESGEIEEYVTPKRQPARAGFTEMPTIPDIDMTETAGGIGDSSFEMETTTTESDTQTDERDDSEEEKEDDTESDEDESYFSDRNRWRRGGIVDPDADDW
ncbi:MAG: hypothetical protein H0W50_11370 [Parachlamydiaceae bacterium]|nr:hypothetical protein [Parachlamydiaceae bacterium]